ncbi:hypothetical protein ACHHYP_20572 [Achlya hypogyna]|uniref:Uncharacterized protein n=1 Tax=Achlya hypogyna TaxID=1202772 RepID=A0A1V9YIF3_ACHHY|nr:hypothetical protein ACHHYP_20572 [Achlya hypogyna]
MSNTNLRQANNFRSKIYNHAKNLGLPVQWRMKTSVMQDVIAENLRKTNVERKASKKFTNAFRVMKTNRILQDQATFNRIMNRIAAPADKVLLANLKDEFGNVFRSVNLNGSHFKARNLSVTERDQFESGADVDLDILPTTMVELEWITVPKRSKSERKNFFPYLTKAQYGLEHFQMR